MNISTYIPFDDAPLWDGETFIHVKVYNICDVLDALGINDLVYEAQCDRLHEWRRANGVWYYGAPREDFSVQVAMLEAHKAGYGAVVVEDLS